MNVTDIATQMVFMESLSSASLAASNGALAPAPTGPVSTPASGVAATLSNAAALSPLASYDSTGASTVYGNASMIGTLLNSLA